MKDKIVDKTKSLDIFSTKNKDNLNHNNSFKGKKVKISMPEFDLLGNQKVDLYKQAINSAIDTYPLEWIVILETLQNSIDAINKNNSIKEGQVDIIFDINEDSVTIIDNGMGFPLKENLFFLHGGTKINDKTTKGKIGVGLKVTIFSSKSFYVSSTFKNGDGKHKLWNCKIENGFQYKDRSHLNAITGPLQETTEPTGTTINYSFPDNYILDFILKISKGFKEIPETIEKSLINKFKKSIEHFFRTNSYSADTNRLIDETSNKKININVKIKYSSLPVGIEEEIETLLKDANGKIEFSFDNKFWDVNEIIQKQRGVNKINIIEYKFYDKEEEHHGRFDPDRVVWIKKFTDREEIKELLPRKHKDAFDNLIKDINGMYFLMGTPTSMKKLYLKPRTFISINGVPSDHLLPNPTSNTAYAKLILLGIIDINSTFNYGKLQTTNRTLIGQCGRFYQQIYNNVIAKVGERVFGKNLEDDTSAGSVEKPIVITSLDNLGISLSFKKIPTDENSLIAIFFEMLGKGLIEGYEFYSLHAKRKYDATSMMKTKNMTYVPKANNDDDLRQVEFKLRLSQLVDELEAGVKNLKEMTLIVVWEDDISGLKNNIYEYEVIDLEDSKDHDKGFFGVKKVLVNSLDGIERQIFVMKEFIDSIKQ